jgi:hypothetical protein
LNGNGSQLAPDGQCPVCGARFRGVAICPRCGADLMPMMLLAAHAYSRRQSARQSLRAGDAQAALAAAEAAQELHATPQGRILKAVCDVAIRAGQPQSSASHAPMEGRDDASIKRRRSEMRLLVPSKALCLSAAILVLVTAYLRWGRHRRT